MPLNETVKSLVNDVANGLTTAEDAAPLIGALVRRWVYRHRNLSEISDDMATGLTLDDDPPIGDNAREFITNARDDGRITSEQFEVLWHSWDDTRAVSARIRRQQQFRTMPDATLTNEGVLENEDLLNSLAAYFGIDRHKFDETFGVDWFTIAADWPTPPPLTPNVVDGYTQWVDTGDLPTRWIFAGNPRIAVLGVEPNTITVGYPVVEGPGDMTISGALDVHMESHDALKQVAAAMIGLRVDGLRRSNQ